MNIEDNINQIKEHYVNMQYEDIKTGNVNLENFSIIATNYHYPTPYTLITYQVPEYIISGLLFQSLKPLIIRNMYLPIIFKIKLTEKYSFTEYPLITIYENCIVDKIAIINEIKFKQCIENRSDDG